MAVKKQRLDIVLYNRGFFESRERARAAVMAGQVRVGGQVAEKPGTRVEEDVSIEVADQLPYVSRGGLKLKKALDIFEIDLSGKTVLDVGASTGGFTDCALQNGASRVFAVDVGYGQLAWKLRSDPRVVVIERTNIKELQAGMLSCRPEFTTIDVSFIALSKVMPPVSRLVSPLARGIALVKPQFEAGRDKVGKNGVVRDPAVHSQVLESICDMVEKNSWSVLGLDFSPIKGPKGNIEYLMYFDFSGPRRLYDRTAISGVVKAAHSQL